MDHGICKLGLINHDFGFHKTAIGLSMNRLAGLKGTDMKQITYDDTKYKLAPVEPTPSLPRNSRRERGRESVRMVGLSTMVFTRCSDGDAGQNTDMWFCHNFGFLFKEF